jgi:hypothetical protein
LKYHHLLKADEKPYDAACLANFAQQVAITMNFTKSMRPLTLNPALMDEWKILAARTQMCSDRLRE